MRHNSAAGTNSSRRFLLRKEDQDATLDDFFTARQPPGSSQGSRLSASPQSARLWTPSAGTSRLSSAMPKSTPNTAKTHMAPPMSARQPTRPTVAMPPPRAQVQSAPTNVLSKRHALWHPDDHAPSTSASWREVVNSPAGQSSPRRNHRPSPASPGRTRFTLPDVLAAKDTPLPTGDAIIVHKDKSLTVASRRTFPLAHISPSDPVVPRPTLKTKRQEVSDALDRLENVTSEKLAVARKHRSKRMGDADYDACDEGEKSLLNIPKPIKEEEWNSGKTSSEFESNFGDIMGMFLSERRYSVEDLDDAIARRLSTNAVSRDGDDGNGSGVLNLSLEDKGKMFRSFKDKHSRKRSAANSSNGLTRR